MDGRVPAGLSAGELRRFGLLVGGAFVLLAGLMAWRGHVVPMYIAGALGCALLLGGLAAPKWLGPAYRGWMRFGQALSRVTTPIIMAAMYFLAFMPIGLMMRALGRNPMVRPNGDSYWVTRPEGGRRGDLTRPF